MADKKLKFFVTSEHTMIGSAGAPSAVLSPGERVQIDENSDSHKFLLEQIEAGNEQYSHLTVQEVNLKDEAKADEERQKMLAKAEKIAAKVRDDEAQALADQEAETNALREQAEEEGQTTQAQATDFPPSDQRAQSLAEQSGPAQRATTQADVVEEQGAKSGRRSSSSKKG